MTFFFFFFVFFNFDDYGFKLQWNEAVILMTFLTLSNKVFVYKERFILGLWLSWMYSFSFSSSFFSCLEYAEPMLQMKKARLQVSSHTLDSISAKMDLWIWFKKASYRPNQLFVPSCPLPRWQYKTMFVYVCTFGAHFICECAWDSCPILFFF